MSLREKLLWIGAIALVFIFTALHLLFQYIRLYAKEPIHMYRTLFSVKQKVCLLVG